MVIDTVRQDIQATASDPGFWLIAGGLIAFFPSYFISGTPGAVVTLVIASLLMLYAGFTVFRDGWIIPVIFFVVGIVLQGKIDLGSALYPLLIITIIGMLVHGVIRRATSSGEERKGSFGRGISKAAVGAIPVIFFIVDVALVHILINPPFSLRLGSVSTAFLLHTPWWVYLGLATTKAQTGLVKFLKFAGILYLVLLVSFLGITGAQASMQVTPDFLETIETEQLIREREARIENPAVSQFKCLSQGRTLDLSACVAERQEEARLEHHCQEIEEHAEGTFAYETCVKEQRELRKHPDAQISGKVDPNQEPMKFVFRFDEGFPSVFSLAWGEPRFTALLEYEIPREEIDILADLSCNFTLRDRTASVEGRISSSNPLHLQERKGKESVTCEPIAPLNGSYKAVYAVILRALETQSDLSRFFIGDKEGENKTDEIAIIAETEGQLSEFADSSAAADPARINFGIGNTPRDPVISSVRSLSIGLSVENSGKGRIIDASYQLHLPGFAASCLSGDIPLTDHQRAAPKIVLPGCVVDQYPEYLRHAERYADHEFSAILHYDYEITAEKEVTVS